MSAAAAGAGAIGAGEYIKYRARERGSRRGEAVRGQGQEEVDRRNDAILQAILEGAGQYKGTDRLAKKNELVDSKEAQLLAAVEQAGGTIEQTQGNVSSEYDQRRTQRLVDAATNAATQAKLSARVGSAGTLQFDESLNNANTRSNVNVKSTNRNDYWQAVLDDIARASQPDENMMLLGSILSGGGQGMLMGG